KLEVETWSESMMPIMEDQITNGLSGMVQRAIDSTRLAAQQAKADLDVVSDAIMSLPDADGKKDKKKKGTNRKKPKTVKVVAAKAYASLIDSYAQQMTAFDR